MSFPSRTDILQDEEKRLKKALKILANGASYGIYAEMNRPESDTLRIEKCRAAFSESTLSKRLVVSFPGS